MPITINITTGKATASDINTGTDNAKYLTSQGLNDSYYLKRDFAKASGTLSGTNTYTVNMTPTLTSYTDKQIFIMKFANGNTGASTLNINSLGSKSIRKSGGTALSSGDIIANQILILAYNSTNDWFEIIGPVISSSGGGITVGTTTITSGTDKRIPFNDAGVYREDANMTFDKTIGRADIGQVRLQDGNAYAYEFRSKNGSSKLYLDGGAYYGYDNYGFIQYGFELLATTKKSFFTRYGRKLATEEVNTAAYTIMTSNHIIQCLYTATGVCTFTLPPCSEAFNAGFGVANKFVILDTGANASVNNIIIQRSGTDTITRNTTGNTSINITQNGAMVVIYCLNATTWKINVIP